MLLILTKRDFYSKSYGQFKAYQGFSYGLQMSFPILYTSSSMNIKSFFMVIMEISQSV